MKFVKESVIRASAEKVFAFHESPQAFEKLLPPWEKVRVLEPPRSLEVGTRVVLETKIGPFWKKIVAEHTAYEAGSMFVDEMTEGPFAKWVHRHVVTPQGEGECILRDEIEYELPLGVIGRMIAGRAMHNKLERLFVYRHRVTCEACEVSRRAR
jgi:ligand-binding SRPBCC domain-containing protein